MDLTLKSNKKIIEKEIFLIKNVYKYLVLISLNLIIGLMAIFLYLKLLNFYNFALPDKVFVLKNQIHVDYKKKYIYQELTNLFLIKSELLEQKYKHNFFYEYSKDNNKVYIEYQKIKNLIKNLENVSLYKIKKETGMYIKIKRVAKNKEDEKTKVDSYFSTLSEYNMVFKMNKMNKELKEKETIFIEIRIYLDNNLKIIKIKYKELKRLKIINKIKTKIKYINKNNFKNYISKDIYNDKDALNILLNEVKYFKKLSFKINKIEESIEQEIEINNIKYIFKLILKNNKNIKIIKITKAKK